MNDRRNVSESTCNLRIVVIAILFAAGLYSYPQTARVASFQSNSRPELVLQRGHSLGVNCGTFSPDGNWFASGGADNAVLIWQVASGRQLRELRGHSGYVRTLAVSADGTLLASGANDRTIRLWDVATGRTLNTFSGHAGPVTALAFSSDRHWLASGSTDKTIKVWDLSTGKELKTLSKHSAAITALTFSHHSQVLASGGDANVVLWDSKSWQELRTLSRHTTSVSAITFSGDDNLFASASTDGNVLVWRSGADRESFVLKNNSANVLAAAFDSTGSIVVIHSDGGVDRWNSQSGRPERSLNGNGAEQLVFAALSPDLNSFASSIGNRIISLKSVSNGADTRTFESHSTSVNAVGFSADGRWFASANSDSSIRLWQTATGRELPRLMGHAGYVTTIAFSPDSRLLASGSRSGEVKVWDLSNSTLAFNLPTRSKGINNAAFSPDGKSLATAGLDQTIDVWNLDTKQARPIRTKTREITSVVFTADGKLFSAGRDNFIQVWDLKTGNLISSLDNAGSETNNISLSSDGQLLAAANSDKTVRVWNTTTNSVLQTLRGHSAEVLTVAFSRDSNFLASGSSDHNIILWDPKSGKNLRQLSGITDGVAGVGFNANGRWLLSGSEDGSMMIWDVESGTLMATLVSLPGSDDWLVTTPDGLFDGSPESWNVMLWRFDNQTFSVLPVESYFNESYYPGVLADILADKNPKAVQDIVQKDRRQPKINIRTNGNSDGTVATRNVDIELEITAALPDQSHRSGSGARDLRLFRNGLLVKAWSGDVLTAGNTRTIQTSIPIVAGENRIAAYAFNRENIKSLDATLTLKGADTLKRQGSAYLVVIGVEQYQNPQYNLRYPVADATEMAAQLKAQQEKLGRYNPIITIPLTNKEATKKNILLALARLAGSNTDALGAEVPSAIASIKAAQPEDAVIVYFSGHGTAVKDRFYLIPHDLGYSGARDKLDNNGLQTILAHSVSDQELEEALRPLDADQVVLVIDACNSGQAIEAQEKRRGPMNTRGLAQLAYEKGIYILTASQSIEVAFEAEALKHSYLAYALLEEGIKTDAADENRDGSIFLKEWFDYANERVPQIRRTRLKGKELVEDEGDEQKVQRPRVFYTREAGAQRFLVARR